jgi:hypothetical protein
MAGDPDLGLEQDQVIVVLMVPMQVLEGVVEVVELANTVGLDMVQGQDQDQDLVHIVKECILNMVLMEENLLMLVVPVVVGVEDKLEVLGIPMLKDPVVALVLALVMLTGIGMVQVLQVQVLMAMVVAQEIVKMVAVAAVLVPELDMAMPTHKFQIRQSKVGAHRSPSLYEVVELFVFFVPLLHFC